MVSWICPNIYLSVSQNLRAYLLSISIANWISSEIVTYLIWYTVGVCNPPADSDLAGPERFDLVSSDNQDRD